MSKPDDLRRELWQRFQQAATWGTTSEKAEPRRADPRNAGALSVPVPIVIDPASSPAEAER